MFPLLMFLMSLKDLGNPTINTSNQEVEVAASISGLPNESYFRVEWQKSSGDTYFGMTKVGETWVEVNPNQDCKNYLHVTDTNTTSLTALTKVGESSNNLANGIYNLKLRRYTASCASYSDSEPVQITLNLPTHAPTTIPATTTLSPNPNRTITPAPIKTPTQPPAPTKSSVSEEITDLPIVNDSKIASPSPQILGAETVSIPSSTNKNSDSHLTIKNTNSLWALVIIGLGIIFVSFAVYLGYKTSKIQNMAK